MSSLILPNSKINNVKMVIFDKDGTLIDIHHYWCSMIEYRAEFFVKSINIENKEELYNSLVDNMGIDLISKKMKPQGPVGIKPRNFIVDVVLNTMLEYDKNYTKEIVESIFKEVDEYSKTKLNHIVKVLPNVKNLLEDLKQSNIQISIATTDLTQRAILAMKSLKLESYFVDIVGADLVENAKPNPDLVEYILRKNNLSKEDVIVVGDSMADLNMAKNAKCRFLAVKTGLYSDEFIRYSEKIVDDFRYIEVEK